MPPAGSGLRSWEPPWVFAGPGGTSGRPGGRETGLGLPVQSVWRNGDPRHVRSRSPSARVQGAENQIYKRRRWEVLRLEEEKVSAPGRIWKHGLAWPGVQIYTMITH